MIYKSNPVGNEITCIMYGLDKALLSDAKKLENLLLEAAGRENFKILDKISHVFKPYGYSAVLLIQESHIAIHTYPEYRSLVFNLYSCRGPQDGLKSYEYFKNALQPSRVEFRQSNVLVDKKI